MDLYIVAAGVLEKFESKQGSVKSLVFASGYKNVRQLYALVCESLKYQPVLTTIFKRSHSLQQEESLQGQDHLATVLLYEHLVGKGLGRAGPIRKCIVKHKKEIEERCQELLQERGVTSLADLLSSQCQAFNNLPIPRYVRVNLLKTTVQEARETFSQEGWEWRGALSLDGFRPDVEALGERGFGADPLLSDLLVFPPGTDLHDHPWVVGGCLALQDRASCFPAHVLNAGKGSVVLDCCAAPGNKTSHIASLMANTGKIWAYERDGKRMGLLQQQLRRQGVGNAKTVLQDFLSLDPLEPRFSQVQFILVDPSCSGSGIMSRMDHVNSTPTSGKSGNSERLLSLQRFQISILKHALKFPGARRVVYSTCSVHEEENEQVVSEVAQQVQGKFKVATVFPQFPHRGNGGGELAKKCVRMSPESDLTNGFFVACFERVSEGVAENENESCGNGCEAMSATRADVLPSKKNRKRKRAEEKSHLDSMASLSSCSVGDNTGEAEKESAEGPKKKKKKNKKKKDKTKKEAWENEMEALEGIGEDRTGELEMDGSEAVAINDNLVAKKQKSSKKGGKKDTGYSTACVAHHRSDATENSSVYEKTSAEAKKRDEKSAGEEASSPNWQLQNQKPDLSTLTPGSGTEELKKKKKKKKKWKQEKQL